ncbi:hypothetical protein OESDEN_01456 [Oesophagostomum dentatum]|uniref:SAM domain-containing protein n=1 Tax=Oesophagostomum dentatum TaxID=61180 RepID=A0A0B1TMU2_OESDE|nr:hypothetical protein OESDEN_01456 [Oesophagostomum dentatum]
MADNEQKSHQIKSLRSALDEQLRSRSQQDEYNYSVAHWNEQPTYDLNTQIRRLLMEEPSEPMTHSTSFPVRLCSSSYQRGNMQPSSSFTSSLSAASSYHSWSQGGNRHLYPSIAGTRSEHSYRSPSSPAARQLAAELDELRRINNETRGNQTYSSTSLPRGMGNKASSTLALPTKKYSLTSGASAVESDDEVTRGVMRSAATSRHSSEDKPLKRDRTRSSLRNLFSKLRRSTSHDRGGHMFGKGNAARSSSSVRHVPGPLSGGVELYPPLPHFVDWRSEQLAEWIGEVGFAQYVPEVAKNVRSGRHLLNMSNHEYETVLGMKSALHRKRLNLVLRRIEGDVDKAASNWDVQQTQKWLEDIGLPQYKDVFCENMIDGSMLLALTAADLVEVSNSPCSHRCFQMRVLNAHHYLCLSRSIQYLKMVDFDYDSMVRKFDEVYEPTFTAETLAEILQMPPHKTLLRRHLTTHFNQLLGQKIVAEKRDFLATGSHPQLVPGIRIKVCIYFSLHTYISVWDS